MGSSGSKPSAPLANAATVASNRPRKNKENFLVPFLRSMSCGTSSSWRTDNFMHESSIMSEDHPAYQIPPEKSTVSNIQPGWIGLQRSGETCFREVSNESSSDNVSAVCYHSMPDIGESTGSSLLNGHSSSILDNASPSFPAQRPKYCHKAASISRSWRPFATNDCPNMSCADISASQLTSEGDEINTGISLRSISRLEDTSGCTSEQQHSANLADFGRPIIPLQDCSSMEISASSSEDTLSTQHSDDLMALQVETSVPDAQTVDATSGLSRGELSGREARRNNGRRLWDALTRASSRRRRFSPPFVLSNEDVVGSRTVNDEWGLFDWNSNEESTSFSYDSGGLSRRSSEAEERRWRTRPQLWALQQFNDTLEGSSGQSRRCASGRHPNGHCACEAFVMTEEWSTRASISRIVMLAEALFEVLDEIHRQSVTLSSSTSLLLVSSPAPESVVESFAVRIHKKCETSVLGQCAECHICLIEYEEGDHIRVLPCCHEFHVSCVDRWLKEAHRVCPLCRHNVCEETGRS